MNRLILNVSLKSAFRKIFTFKEGGILLSLIIIYGVVHFLSPNFSTYFNISTIVLDISFLGMVALGETLVLIGGGIDLSIGGIAGLSGIVAGLLMVNSSIPPLACVVMGIFVGTGCGLLNALLIIKLKIHPLIVTLGTGEIFSGLVLIITKGLAIVRIPKSVYFLGQAKILGIPLPAIILIVTLIILQFILSKTVIGRRIFVLGGSEETADLLGISPAHLKFIIYSIAGTLYGFAGVVMVARLTSAQPTIGQYWILPAVAAAVIGGTSLMGGEGTLVGSIIGSAIMRILGNAIIILGISTYAERAVVGSLVIVAVFIDVVRRGVWRMR